MAAFPPVPPATRRVCLVPPPTAAVPTISNIDTGVVVPIPTLPSFLTNNKDVEALLITERAAVVESEPDPAIVVLANRPVEVPMPMLPDASILILSEELVAKMIGLEPVVEAVSGALLKINGVCIEVEKVPVAAPTPVAPTRLPEFKTILPEAKERPF